MAHYAQLDENNVVIRVFVGKDETDSSVDWEKHYTEITGYTCKRTSYNTFGGVHRNGGMPFRLNYAGIGYTYSAELDAFILPKPFPSWILDTQTGYWNAPSPSPEISIDEYMQRVYTVWNEQTLSWDIIQPTETEE